MENIKPRKFKCEQCGYLWTRDKISLVCPKCNSRKVVEVKEY